MTIKRKFITIPAGCDGKTKNQIITAFFLVFQINDLDPIAPPSPVKGVGEGVTIFKDRHDGNLFSNVFVHLLKITRIKSESQLGFSVSKY